MALVRTKRGKHVAQIVMAAGTVEITLDVDLFRLSQPDREFVESIVELMRTHSQAVRQPGEQRG